MFWGMLQYVNFGQINDIIRGEEWLQGEVNCWCNIASLWITSLSWGAKKKESKNSDALWVCVGDCVSVENHGKHWIHLGHIINIDNNTKTAIVKWKETLKKDTVLTWVTAKSTTNLMSFQGNVNLQVSFVRCHKLRGESHLLAKWKTCFYIWKDSNVVWCPSVRCLSVCKEFLLK